MEIRTLFTQPYSKKPLLIAILLCLFLNPSQGFADTSSVEAKWVSVFEDAKKNYEAKRYDEAVFELEKIIENEYLSSQVFYNLGNAYFKLAQIGNARWAYESALLRSPRDPDIRKNLTQLHQYIEEEYELSVLNRILNSIKYYLNYIHSKELAIALAALFGLMTLLILACVFQPVWRPRLQLLVVICAIGGMVMGSFLYLRWNEIQYPGGIINEKEVYVRYGPNDLNTKAFLLKEGSKVAIESETGGWFFVRFGQEQSGWLPKTSVLKIQ